MWWKYVGCLLEDVGEKDPCGGKKYQTDLGSFLIITSPLIIVSRNPKNKIRGHLFALFESYTLRCPQSR